MAKIYKVVTPGGDEVEADSEQKVIDELKARGYKDIVLNVVTKATQFNCEVREE